MNITNTARIVNGKLVYDKPKSQAERLADFHRFNEMVAARQAPGTKGSDRAYLAGQHDHGFTDEPDWMRETMLAKAKAAGVVTQGKKYVGGLADKRGVCDPLAWISDVGELKRVAEARNKNLTGIVEQEGHEVPPPPDVPLNPKLVKTIIADYESVEPKYKEKRREEMAEMVIDRHGKPAHERGMKRKKAG